MSGVLSGMRPAGTHEQCCCLSSRLFFVFLAIAIPYGVSNQTQIITTFLFFKKQKDGAEIKREREGDALAPWQLPASKGHF
jgi:hypothetical protein